MDPDSVEVLSQKKRTLTFSRGETVFHLGDSAGFFYCINDGKVQLYRSSPYREQSFAILGKGDWLGHRDVIAGGEYRHNARCLTKTTVCKFPADELLNHMEKSPRFASQVAHNLAHSWIESEHQSYNLGARKVMERLADFLLSLQGENNGIDAANQEIDLNLTREMLATLMGTTTESVIRTLSDFKARGWIKMDKGRVCFINAKELGKLVEEA
ncbi:MAG: Crp/Fnr family transcriptional regulator [Leptospiraceae bacterium]|nr:Crp/Fnr family transcriptional regulator [Leptospiraceae bacterium]